MHLYNHRKGTPAHTNTCKINVVIWKIITSDTKIIIILSFLALGKCVDYVKFCCWFVCEGFFVAAAVVFSVEYFKDHSLKIFSPAWFV